MSAIKLDKVYRSDIRIGKNRDIIGYDVSCWHFSDWMDKHYPHQQLKDYMNFRVKLAYKVGRRRKLKSVVIHYYNAYRCECCGPYYMLQICK